MKIFKIQGWYNKDKDFELDYFLAKNTEQAIEKFKYWYAHTNFYKIDIKEIL